MNVTFFIGQRVIVHGKSGIITDIQTTSAGYQQIKLDSTGSNIWYSDDFEHIESLADYEVRTLTAENARLRAELDQQNDIIATMSPDLLQVTDENTRLRAALEAIAESDLKTHYQYCRDHVIPISDHTLEASAYRYKNIARHALKGGDS